MRFLHSICWIDNDIIYDIILPVGLYDKLKAGKPLSKKEAETLLKEMGYGLSHVRGSHHHWVKGGTIFTLPVHGKELKSWVTRELKRMYYEKK